MQPNATEHKTDKAESSRPSLPIPPTPTPTPPPSQQAAPLGFPSPLGHHHHGLRRRRRLVRRRGRGCCGGQVADGRDAGLPVLPGPVDAARDGPVGGHAGGGRRLRAPGLVHPRLLHRQLRPRDLPPQPPHRLPLPHGRPGARPLRRRTRRARPPHPRIRRVQAFHQEATRVQVLVCNHKGFCYSFCHDFLLHLRRPCLLAYTALLLDCTLCAHHEAPDSAHGQVQICALQHREAEIRREEGWREQQLVERLIPGCAPRCAREQWKGGRKIQSNHKAYSMCYIVPTSVILHS